MPSLAGWDRTPAFCFWRYTFFIMLKTSSSHWAQITALNTDGFNLIPVRDKDEGESVAKAPYRQWTKYKTEILPIDELWNQMDFHNTTAIAVVCGTISKNLCIIDIDSKHKAGIDAVIFSDLKSLYPELWEKLRIHKTPSGGYHLLFRTPDHTIAPGCKNLAIRPSTEAELIAQPKRKTRCFIEIKGEGGLSQMPPSAGYTVIQDLPVPIITLSESSSILNLMCGYTEVIDIPHVYKPTKHDDDYYDENPFDHFNGSHAAEQVLTDAGWKLKKKNNLFVWFTHPESKSGGIHASFNRAKRVYFIFTSNSEFDSGKGYMPATALSIIAHGGDRRKTYTYLVENGFGKIKPSREKFIVKKAAINKKLLPTNISPAAAQLHAVISQKMETDHPYGIFFEQTEIGIIINRENLYHVADKLNFKLHNQSDIVQIVENIIHDRDPRFLFDTIKSYIKEEDEDTYTKICNSYEAFIEAHGKFTITRLQLLDPSKVLSDTRTDCYKFYKNGMLHITCDQFTLQPIPSDKFIWNKNIQQRSFIDCNEGLYVDFLEKAIGITPYLLSCIGYLAHEFKDDTAGYIIVLSEQCVNPKDGGGSGKNIFSGLFKNITTFFSKAGSQVKYDEKFMQAWNFQKVFSISDVMKNFSFEFLKEFTSGTATMKKLHVNEYSIPTEDMPKFIISTQFSVDIKDGGIKRRVRTIEFTDFFTKAGGVDVHYQGKHFTDNWTEQDWGGYDTTMALSIQQWLKDNRKLTAPVLTISGWHKQFEQTYGRVINGIIQENIDIWCERKFITNDDFKKDCQTYYDENNIISKYRPSSYSFNDAIADWCKKFMITYDKDATERQQGIKVRGREFKK